MPGSKGWVKIDRELQDHWIWEDIPYANGQAWVDLILLANHADKKTFMGGEVITISRGCFFTSERKLAERWGWSSKRVRNFLKLLENENMIELGTSRLGSAINIVNYSVWQGSGITQEAQKKHQGSTEEARGKRERPTNKKERIKELKKKEKPACAHEGENEEEIPDSERVVEVLENGIKVMADGSMDYSDVERGPG